MTLSPGSRLGPYEILAPLGAGGMGEVYRARDTRLDRTVAVKVLPSHLSASPEARPRFEREARAVSSLNHPHIYVLHDVGRHLAYISRGVPGTGSDIWVLPLSGDPKPTPFLQTGFLEEDPQLSPHGHWIAYSSIESERVKFTWRRFPGPAASGSSPPPEGVGRAGVKTGGRSTPCRRTTGSWRSRSPSRVRRSRWAPPCAVVACVHGAACTGA